MHVHVDLGEFGCLLGVLEPLHDFSLLAFAQKIRFLLIKNMERGP